MSRLKGQAGIGMTSERTRKRLIDRLRTKGIHDERVLEAMLAVPRHLFVDEALASRAYDDTPLPIGRGQTISQPFVVALMTQAVMRDEPLGKVLEIGTGSAYQAAVLSHLADQVFSTERIGKLLRTARLRLYRPRLPHVYLRHAHGLERWRSQAPCAALVVSAGGRIPAARYDPLAVGGALVAAAQRAGGQEVLRIWRTSQGLERHDLGALSF